MINRIMVLFALMLSGAFVFTVHGCSGGSTTSDTAPSDEEVLKAINNTGLFSGGVEKLLLKSPIEVMERGGRNSDGSWSTKVRIIYVSTAGGRESAPMEKMSMFRIYRSKNSSGATVWRAVVSSQ